MIGTPISVYMFGGLSGRGTDLLVGALLQAGQQIFTSAFIPRILSNIVEKPLSCLLVVLFISKMPKNFLVQFKSQKN